MRSRRQIQGAGVSKHTKRRGGRRTIAPVQREKADLISPRFRQNGARRKGCLHHCASKNERKGGWNGEEVPIHATRTWAEILCEAFFNK